MVTVDINCDLEEAYGYYRLREEEEILKRVTSVNIPCGFHAGNPHIICRMVEAALAHQVKVGAHPGFPDMQGFGYRSMNLSLREVYEIMLYQVSALEGITRAYGGDLHHVKLHGALYNEAAERPELAEVIIRAILEVKEDIILYALSGSSLVHIGLEYGLQVAEEVFADRIYLPNGRLAPRELEGSVLHRKEDQLQQASSLILDQRVRTADGNYIELAADTLCIHRENLETIAFLEDLQHWASENGVKIEPIQPR